MIGDLSIVEGWSITVIVGRNMYPSSTLNAWRKPESSHQLAALVTVMTTPWRRQSMAFTRLR